MRDHFAQKLQPLAGEIISDCGKTGRMTSGPRQTGNQAGADGIAGRCKDDGNRLRRLLQCLDGRGARRDDDVHVELCELGRDFGKALGMSLYPAIFDRDRASFDPTELTQSLHEGIGPFACRRVLGTRNPMVGSLPACCARAASGQAAIMPPSAASNSRRPMVTVIRPSRARCVEAMISRHRACGLHVQQGHSVVGRKTSFS